MFEFSGPELAVALIASAIGFVYLQFGRKQAQINFMVCGVALMTYSYFVSTLMLAIVIGLLIALLPLTIWR